jgi:catechol 1,2-dioxygenase
MIAHKPLTTQIFDRNDQYLENDSVFAVKDSLVVDFVPIKDAKKLENGQQPTLELVYDISLAPRK